MPLYDFKCGNCGHAAEEVFRMSDPNVTTCPQCSCVGSYVKQVSLPSTDLREFRTPIEMYSIGMEDQGQIRAFKRQCPDVDLSDDPRDEMFGVPVARTRKAKLQALKAAGFVETK